MNTYMINLNELETALVSNFDIVELSGEQLTSVVGGEFSWSGLGQAIGVGGVGGVIAGSATGAIYGAFGGTVALPGGGTVVGATGGFLVGGIFGGLTGAIGGAASYIAKSMVS
jgi:hypothetical protein